MNAIIILHFQPLSFVASPFFLCISSFFLPLTFSPSIPEMPVVPWLVINAWLWQLLFFVFLLLADHECYNNNITLTQSKQPTFSSCSFSVLFRSSSVFLINHNSHAVNVLAVMQWIITYDHHCVSINAKE